jgi:hypothetical protein
MTPRIPDLIADIVGAAIGRVAANPGVPGLKPADERQVAREVAREARLDPRLTEIEAAPDPKPWWASATIWGVLVSAAFKAVAVVLPGTVDPALEGPATQLVLLGLSFVGDALAFIGRLRARQPIGSLS